MLILDEPCAGLDPRGRDRILGQIREYHETKKNCVLIVSHSMEDIAKFASKVLVMNQAKVFTYDTVEHVFSRAEEIQKMGLNIPQITRVFMGLRARGFDVPQNVYTVGQAKEILLRLLAERGNRHA